MKTSFHDVSRGGETMNFEQFTSYMVSITEDKSTPDQLRQSFLVISGGKVGDMRASNSPKVL